MGDTKTDKLRIELYNATRQLSELQLFHAAKWCAEALNGLDFELDFLTELPTEFITAISPEERSDQQKVLLAKSYMNCKEFDRAAHVLKQCQSGNGLFLRLYSILILVDKKATEETDGSVNIGTYNAVGALEAGTGENEVVNGLNNRLSKIIQEVEAFHSKGTENAFLYYLSGVIYNKKKKHALAQVHLYNSLKLFPYNWSCWQELIASLNSFDEAIGFINKVRASKNEISLNIMFHFFEVVILQEFYQLLTKLSDSLASLVSTFPKFNFLKVQQFLIAYHNLDYFQAESIFDKILVDDPLRLDDLDTYSNMLYVMEKRSKLSFLAQFASLIDKFRPETCCIIANYHSMKCEHGKAIMYYKRALTLNKNCLSAWTLMGHEFVELKNSHAAIESYRRAVDTNSKDFRAWYGLGQAYEVLDMHLYALYYYQRATNLQPLDKRMWQAIGNCYEKIEQFGEAIKSFEKALSIDRHNSEESDGSYSTEPHICYRLALIYENLDRNEETYKWYKQTNKYMKLCFAQEDEWGVSDSTSKARLWLARDSLKHKRYEEAYELAKDLNHNNAHDIQDARSIAQEARNLMLKKH